MNIRAFKPEDADCVVRLWHEAGLTRPWNDPHADITRKLTEQPELFLVAEVDGRVVGTAMVGFDGHRGWLYYFAVDTDHRRQAIGSALLREAEHLLTERGCPKLNLLVRSSNAEVVAFYRALGYAQDDVIGLGKRLIEDQPPAGVPTPSP